MYHAFCAVNNGYLNTIKNPIYLLNPKIDFYYVAAEETMNKGILPKIFKIAGAVTVKRTWRAEGKNVNRMVDMSEVDNIMKALDNGWVATFPQGTTSAFAQGRRGTAKLVKNQRPIVIPIIKSTVTGTSTSTTVTGLSPLTTYNFYLIAKDAFGNTSPQSNIAAGTTLDGPAGGSCGTEDFSNIPTSTNPAYATRVWTNNSITWTAVD